MRKHRTYRIEEEAMPQLHGIDEPIVLLHSNDPQKPSYLAIGAISSYSPNEDELALQGLQRYIDQLNDWVFGYLSYDLKNEIEPQLKSEHPDQLGFAKLHFIQPRVVAEWKDQELTVHYIGENDESDALVALFGLPDSSSFNSPGIKLEPQIPASTYLRDVMSLKSHIQQGDIYEINYCMQFGAKGQINPYEVWESLNHKTRAPFSIYLQLDPLYLLCASPERFLKRTGNTIVSQPIKGTKKRSSEPDEDLALIHELKGDPKERSENIMITDLVRNDLSKSAVKGSVKVDELCEVYSFTTVHQLISTVSCEVGPNCSFSQLIKDTFPMGSMTGAPKIRAMELIEVHEKMKRGLYSGSVGYIKPNGDFDFNVVIRSILYNREKMYLSAMVGGAITAASLPESEYQECLLKAQALLHTLN